MQARHESPMHGSGLFLWMRKEHFFLSFMDGYVDAEDGGWGNGNVLFLIW